MAGGIEPRVAAPPLRSARPPSPSIPEKWAGRRYSAERIVALRRHATCGIVETAVAAVTLTTKASVALPRDSWMTRLETRAVYSSSAGPMTGADSSSSGMPSSSSAARWSSPSLGRLRERVAHPHSAPTAMPTRGSRAVRGQRRSPAGGRGPDCPSRVTAIRSARCRARTSARSGPWRGRCRSDRQRPGPAAR